MLVVPNVNQGVSQVELFFEYSKSTIKNRSVSVLTKNITNNNNAILASKSQALPFIQ